MGRARRMVNGFMSDFMEGWQEDRANEQYRIGNKAAEITANDYFDYQSSRINAVYSPNRRINEFIGNSPENVLVKKVDSKLIGVVEMLKNLQPKNKSKTTSAENFIDGIESQNYSHIIPTANNADQYLWENSRDVILSSSKLGGEKKVAKRSAPVLPTIFVPPPQSQQLPEFNKSPFLPLTPASKRVYNTVSAALPKFEDLPPADYSYVKNGVHHHVHDLRKNKSPRPSKKGEWLSFDFEDAILSVMGLSHPGRSVKHSAAKCSKIYIFQVILRFIQTALVG